MNNNWKYNIAYVFAMLSTCYTNSFGTTGGLLMANYYSSSDEEFEPSEGSSEEEETKNSKKRKKPANDKKRPKVIKKQKSKKSKESSKKIENKLEEEKQEEAQENVMEIDETIKSIYFSSEDDESFLSEAEFEKVVAVSQELARKYQQLIGYPKQIKLEVSNAIAAKRDMFLAQQTENITQLTVNSSKVKEFVKAQKNGHQFTVSDYKDWMALANHLSVNKKVQLYPCDVAIDFGDGEHKRVIVYYRQGNDKGDKKNGKKYKDREGYSSSFDCYFIGPDGKSGKSWEAIAELCNTTACELGKIILGLDGEYVRDMGHQYGEDVRDMGHQLLAKMILYVYAGKGSEIFNNEGLIKDEKIKKEVKETIAEFMGLSFGVEASRLPFMQFITLELLFRIAKGDTFGKEENRHKQPYNFLNAFGAFRKLDNEWRYYDSKETNYQGYQEAKVSPRYKKVIGKHPQTGSSLFTNLKVFLGLKKAAKKARVYSLENMKKMIWENLRTPKKEEDRRDLHQDRLKCMAMIRVCNLVKYLLKENPGYSNMTNEKIAEDMIKQLYNKLDLLAPFTWQEYSHLLVENRPVGPEGDSKESELPVKMGKEKEQYGERLYNAIIEKKGEKYFTDNEKNYRNLNNREKINYSKFCCNAVLLAFKNNKIDLVQAHSDLTMISRVLSGRFDEKEEGQFSAIIENARRDLDILNSQLKTN